MSNPVSPSGSPVPQQEPSKPSQASSEQENKPVDEHPQSPTPESGLGKPHISGATAPDTPVQTRSVSSQATHYGRPELLQAIEQYPEAKLSSPVVTCTRVILLYGLDKPKQAQELLDKLVTGLAQDHVLYPLATFWQVLLMIEEADGTPSVSVVKKLEQARQLGFAPAIPFLAATNTGTYHRYSQIKWQNYDQVQRLLLAYPQEAKAYKAALNRYIAHIKTHDTTDETYHQCCRILAISTDQVLKSLAKNHSVLGFMISLCQLLAEGGDEKIEELYHRVREMRTSNYSTCSDYRNWYLGFFSYDTEPCVKTLSKIGHPRSLYCAASIRRRQFDEAKTKQQQHQYRDDMVKLYLRAADSIPMVFDTLGEFLMKNGDMKEAADVYAQAINKINDFLNGKTRMLGLVVGENAGILRQKKPEWADEINLDELSACEEMLQLFKAKLSLCEMALKETTEPAAKQKKPKKKKKRKTTGSLESTATSQPSADTLTETSSPLPTVQPLTPEQTARQTSPPLAEAEKTARQTSPPVAEAPTEIKPSLPTGQLVTPKKTDSKASSAALPLLHEYNTLQKANQKIRLDSDYDKASELLKTVSAPGDHPLWFKRKQHTAWLYLQQSQDDLYLRRWHKGSDLIKARSDLQAKARKEVKSGLNKLIKLCRPDFQGDVLLISVEEAMEIAKELEQRNFGFVVEFSSLYSTMGHILKAERDQLNPRTETDQCSKLVRQAGRLFMLAHKLLGKRLS